MSSSKSNHLPKAPSPNTFTRGVRSLRGTQFNLWLMTDQRNLNFLFSILENNSAIPFLSHNLIYAGLVFLPGESQGQMSLAGYSPWGHKESDMTEATVSLHFQRIYLFLTIFKHTVWFHF